MTATIAQKQLSSSFQTHTSLRVFGSITIAGMITFALFVIMYEMIRNDTLLIVKPKPPLAIDPIFKEVDEKLIVKPSPLPKPEVVRPPSLPKESPKSEDPKVISFTPNQGVKAIDVSPTITLGGNPNNREITPIIRIDPSYPIDAARDGIEGYVELNFSVNELGSVTDIVIVDSSPKRMFDRAAKRALAKWKYRPRTKNGTAINQTGLSVVLEFTLSQ